jgi:hydroxymethylpyrimidine kinase/phosphomethylpyrimidine kinase/thiamine-phosphate diphosphorylase
MARWFSLTATDSSTGAGAFADVKVAQQLNSQCEVIVLAITAQNSQGAQAAFALPITVIEAQWRSALADGLPEIIRLGWLPFHAELLHWLLHALDSIPVPVIWDPVLGASQGQALSQNWQDEKTRELLLKLMARVDLITPNFSEACLLTGCTRAEEACMKLQEIGAKNVLIKGVPHARGIGDYFCFSDNARLAQHELPGASLLRKFYLVQPPVAQSVHGTGCCFIAHVASFLSQGRTLYDALFLAAKNTRLKRLNKATAEPNDWPHVFAENEKALAFKALPKELGLYGLVDNLAHLKRLLALGIECLQWRVKNPGAQHKAQTQEAIALCRAAGVLLFINDDWALALELGADGVHLGQEDLAQADLAIMAHADLYLGVSTHSEWEFARALALTPSYIALGPVFEPLSKKLRYAPLGVVQVAHYVQSFPRLHLTCIGGITEHNAASVWATGIGSVAVVTALLDAPELPRRAQALKRPN